VDVGNNRSSGRCAGFRINDHFCGMVCCESDLASAVSFGFGEARGRNGFDRMDEVERGVP